MDTIFEANIFFFITSISVILVASALVVVLVYVVSIMRDLKHITRRAREESRLISDDIAQLRTEVKKQGFKVRHFITFFENLFKRQKGRKRW